MSKVMIEPATHADCRRAVAKAFELFPQDLTGKRVLIKPNVLRGVDPADGVTTHPAVLEAVVDLVAGQNPAELIVGDNPGVMSYGANEASFKQTGLLEAARGYYRNIGNDAVDVPIQSAFFDKVTVSRAVLEADVVISLPKFKTHGLTIITGALKNSYGILPGAQKARFHRLAGNPERFADLMVDVFRLRPPDLFIMDAVIGMEGNGPASTELREINKILASDNAVALDAVVARMMGLSPESLRFLKTAKNFGLGDFEDSSVEIVGQFEVVPDFKLPPSAHGGEAMPQQLQELIHSRTLVRPKVDLERCTGCGTCVDQCPVSALTMEDGHPEVDKETCITCFCCQEMCPEQAIALQ